MYCRNCGKRMESTDDFCINCKAVMFDKMNLSSEELTALMTEAAPFPTPAQAAPAPDPYVQAPAQQVYTQASPAAYTQVSPAQGAQQIYTQMPSAEVPGTTPMPSGGYVQWGTPVPPAFGPMTGFGTALASAILGFFAFIFSIVLVSMGGGSDDGEGWLFLPCAIVSLVLGLKTLISVVRLRKKTGYTSKLALAFSIVGIAESGAAFLITGIVLLVIILVLATFAGL